MVTSLVKKYRDWKGKNEAKRLKEREEKFYMSLSEELCLKALTTYLTYLEEGESGVYYIYENGCDRYWGNETYYYVKDEVRESKAFKHHGRGMGRQYAYWMSEKYGREMFDVIKEYLVMYVKDIELEEGREELYKGGGRYLRLKLRVESYV